MHDVPHMLTLAASTHNLPLLTTIAAAFAAAWVLGLVTHRLGLSPIVGYLLAGVVIGPYTPGFTGDVDLAQQLAEVGVILLMFGVGLHFHLKDLLAVKGVALPGAIAQSLVATLATVAIFHFFGWPLRSGIVLVMAMAVASTVVLLRVLMDRNMLNTSHGHVAVGWLIVEDILIVLALVLIPLFAVDPTGTAASPGSSGLATVGWAVLKLIALVAIVLLAGSRIVPWVLTRVAKLRSAELFTLTVLVLSVTIAVGSATLFGASVALGAFLAGMVVAQSPVSHQAAADALPMRDAFAVLFFVSVGMLFDPSFLIAQPLLVVSPIASSASCVSAKPASREETIRARRSWRKALAPPTGAYRQPGTSCGTSSPPPRTASTWLARKCLAAAAIPAHQISGVWLSSGCRLSLQPGRSGRKLSTPALSSRRMTSTVKRLSRLASSNSAGTISSRQRRCWSKLSAISSAVLPSPSGQGQLTGFIDRP